MGDRSMESIPRDRLGPARTLPGSQLMHVGYFFFFAEMHLDSGTLGPCFIIYILLNLAPLV